MDYLDQKPWAWDRCLFVQIHKISDKAILPTYGHDGDACFDLYAIEDVTLRPGDIKMIRTGLAVAIPEGHEMIIRPRSGMSLKGIIIPNSPCTIDAGYRGEIKTPFMNVGDKIIGIKAGDRYAQGTVKPIWLVVFNEVEMLPGSARGTGGFGSTGA